MKKLYLLFLLILLSACSSTWLKVSFDDFSLRVDSWSEYQDISGDVGSPILKGYKTVGTWVQSSLLIMKYPNDNQTLEEVFVYNTSNVKSIYQTSQEFTFICRWQNIPNILFEFGTEKDWKILYFAQDFYIYNNEAYIISFSSDIKGEINKFVEWVKEIKCK